MARVAAADEPISVFDNWTEAEVIEVMDRQRTVILIAERLTAVHNYYRNLLLKQGKIGAEKVWGFRE